MKSNVLGVIPARYDSSRLPGKPLVKIAGIPLIKRVWDRCCQSTLIDKLLVATDDERIEAFVRSFGGNVVMTSKNHKSGTDRISEAVKSEDYKLVINIQGDEPLISGKVIDSAIAPLLANEKCLISSCMKKITVSEEIHNPNVVKVITDHNSDAIYFSRHPIPFNRNLDSEISYFKHIGIYCYQKSFLEIYCKLESPVIENTEKLEQLRALYHGYKIRMVETNYESIGVDTPDDILKVEQILESQYGK
ncbi:3-deoxy-manno-octulosonate cytidylyltransferase [bacterium]|nr:3-deoxy-manno-octulosonate cytidylyltransferase [bacterium]